MINKAGFQYIFILFVTSLFLSAESMAQPCPVIPSFLLEKYCDSLVVQNTSVVNSGNVDSVFWHFGEGDTLKILTAPFYEELFHIFSAEGNYIISMTVFNSEGCDTTKSKPFDFYYPQANYVVVPGCPDEVTLFNDLSNAGSGAGTLVVWEWDFGDGSPHVFTQNTSHTYVQNGDYNSSLTVTNSYGCADELIIPVIQERPMAGFKADTVCFGNLTSFTDTSQFNPVSPINSWSWDFGDGSGTSTTQNPGYDYGDHGEYYVELLVENTLGCTASVSQMILVDTIPVANFTFDIACEGLQTCFYDESVANSDSLISWIWDFGDGSISYLENPCHVYSNTGSFVVSLTVTNSDGCVSLPAIQTLYVSTPPETDFSFTDVCFGETTFFTNLTDTMGYTVNSWFWEFGDPASGANNTSGDKHTNHLFTAPEQYFVKLKGVNEYGCSDSITKTVSVDSIPDAFFQMADTVSIGFEFIIENLSIPHGSVILNNYWDFGDGTTATNINPVIHTYENSGTYTICLTIEDLNGCSSMFCDSIVIMGPPLANFQYASDTTFETFFYDMSSPANTIVSWFWDFGDPTTTSDTLSGVQNPSYTYPEEGFYEVCLWIVDRFGGTDNFCLNIYAGNAVIASFEEFGVCLGDTTFFIDLSYSPISAGFESWYWDFGDGEQMFYNEEIDTIAHKYAGPGVYEVKLGLSANVSGFFMTDTLHKTIRIFEPPVCTIDSTGLGICLGSPIDFTDFSGASPYDPITNWHWDFGNGDSSIIQHPVYTYADTGSYHVQLNIITQHGCSDIDDVMAYVNFAPDFSFKVIHGCVNSPATFVPQYDSSKIIIVGWNWNFGDLLSDSTNPNTSTAKEPSHIFSRIQLYNIRMEMSALGCEGYTEETILIYPIPYSQFSFTADNGGVQGSTKFTNESIYATSYLWDFGNGNTSTVEDPLEIYEKDSTYTISLVSYNEYGCTDTSYSELLVFFKGLYFPTAFSPNNPNDAISRFEPKGINLSQYLVQVFDLRGNLMWESSELDENGAPTESWDGYYNGILMPSGMYVWQAYGIFKDGTEWEGQSFESDELPKVNGIVTLIR